MKDQFLFSKKNYILLIAGLVSIAIGFLLMMGGGSDNPQEFNPDIFNAQRTTIAPLFILAGFVLEIFAIISKPKN